MLRYWALNQLLVRCSPSTGPRRSRRSLRTNSPLLYLLASIAEFHAFLRCLPVSKLPGGTTVLRSECTIIKHLWVSGPLGGETRPEQGPPLVMKQISVTPIAPLLQQGVSTTAQGWDWDSCMCSAEDYSKAVGGHCSCQAREERAAEWPFRSATDPVTVKQPCPDDHTL